MSIQDDRREPEEAAATRRPATDPLADYLDGSRARHAFLMHVPMEPPWAISIDDDAPLTLVAVLTGTMWLRPAGKRPVRLQAGAVAAIQAGTPYQLSSDMSRGPDIHIGPGQRCTSRTGMDLSDKYGIGVRQWGNDVNGRDSMLVASYHSRAEVGRMLLRALPDVLVLPSLTGPYVEALASEVRRQDVAQTSMLDRLLDIVLVSVVRSWAQDLAPERRTWLASNRDDVVHLALSLLHARPEHPWTVESLAREIAISRSALARRFQYVVGSSPIAYLNEWRLTLAADLMRDPDLTLSAIASKVGYSNAFSLSAAFKRHHGVSPAAYRTSL